MREVGFSSEELNDVVDVLLGAVEEFALYFAEFVNGELEVLGHLGELVVVLLVEYLHELLNNQNVEVVNAVFEYVNALVLDNCVVSKRLINTPVSRDVVSRPGASIRHLFSE